RGHTVDAHEHRHLPVIAGMPSDDAAERAPFAELARCVTDLDDQARQPPLVEMITVARSPSGQSGAERRRAALEIRARAAHAIGIDHDAGVAIGAMLPTHRRHDGLIIDAGVGHQHAERLEGGNRPALEVDHPRLLLEPHRGSEIGAARIGDGRDADAALRRRKTRHPLEPFDTCGAERLGVSHDVRLTDRHEILRTEESANLDLVIDRPGDRRPEFAGAHRLFFTGEFHRAVYWLAPDSTISGVHLSTSERTSWPRNCGVRSSAFGRSAPSCSQRLVIAGSCIALSTAALSLSTIAFGVPFGANS